MHKVVTGRVEAKKLLSRRSQSEYTDTDQVDMRKRRNLIHKRSDKFLAACDLYRTPHWVLVCTSASTGLYTFWQLRLFQNTLIWKGLYRGFSNCSMWGKPVRPAKYFQNTIDINSFYLY